MTPASGPRRSFDDLCVGERFPLAPTVMTAERILAFARDFDPQTLHLDPTVAAASPLGGVAASGWHSSALAMRLTFDSWLRQLGPPDAMAVEQTAWPRPARQDETVLGEGRILDTSPADARRGCVRVGIALREAAGGDEVMRAIWRLWFARSDGIPPPERAEDVAPPDRCRAVAPHLAMLTLDGAERDRPIHLGAGSAGAAEMVAFAREFDPQPIHVDPAAAARGRFGRLTASGWHIAALWMRCNVLARQRLLAGLPTDRRRQLEQSAAIGLGFDDLTWPEPVFADSRLHAFITPLETRASRSRPGWGITRWRAEMRDDDDRLVLRFHPSLLMRRA